MGRARVGNVSNRRRYPGIWITDYGAVGNDSTNNTTAIQNAFNAASPLTKPVFIPPGIFRHGSTVSADSLTIYGVGDQSVLKATTPAASALMTTGTNVVLFNFKRTIAAPGSRLGPNESQSIANLEVTNITVMNIHVVNSAAGGIFFKNAVTSKVWNNWVENTNADGMSHVTDTFSGGGVSSDNDIQFNYMSATGDDGISTNNYDGGTQVRVNIQNNTVINNTTSRNIGLDGGSTITVTGNHFEGGTAVGASGNSAWATPCPDHVTISGNTIKNQVVAGGAPPWDNVNGGAINLYNNRTDIPQVMNNVTVTNNQILNATSNMAVINGTGNFANTVSIVNNDYYGPSVTLVSHTGSGTSSAVTTGNVNHGTVIPADLVPVIGGLDPTWRLSFRTGSAWNQGFVVKWS